MLLLITKNFLASRQGGNTLSQVTGRAPVMALGAVSKGWLSKQANMEHLWLMQMTSSNGHLKLVEL